MPPKDQGSEYRRQHRQRCGYHQQEPQTGVTFDPLLNLNRHASNILIKPASKKQRPADSQNYLGLGLVSWVDLMLTTRIVLTNLEGNLVKRAVSRGRPQKRVPSPLL